MHDRAWQCCRRLAVLPSVLAYSWASCKQYSYLLQGLLRLTPDAPHLGRLAFTCRATTSRTPAALSSPTSMTSACPLPRRPPSCPPWARAPPAPGQPPLACPAPTRRCRPTTAACPARCSTLAAPTLAARARRPRTPATPAQPQPLQMATLWTPKREPSARTWRQPHLPHATSLPLLPIGCCGDRASLLCDHHHLDLPMMA